MFGPVTQEFMMLKYVYSRHTIITGVSLTTFTRRPCTGRQKSQRRSVSGCVPLGVDTAMPGWLHARLCHTFLVVLTALWLRYPGQKIIPRHVKLTRLLTNRKPGSIHCKNIRISTDILWLVFHILTELVPYTFVSVSRRNNEVQTLFHQFTYTNVY